jgi:ketosteroid isomerase-like protein
MPGRQLPPVAAAIAFVDCINRGDLDTLGQLMSDDHALQVFEEPPPCGRTRNVEAWRGYVTSFPDYVIYPHRVAADGDRVAILGHTTGSHVALSDQQEEKRTLIWVAETDGRAVRSWRLTAHTEQNRHILGLDLV